MKFIRVDEGTLRRCKKVDCRTWNCEMKDELVKTSRG
jgi:hypothetical protein